MHALLETNLQDNILCVQEPWFSRIGTRWADKEKYGVDVLGGAVNQQWELIYPYFDDNHRAKVMTYARKHNPATGVWRNGLEVVTRLDLAQHPCILVTDVHAGKDMWWVVNFYNDVADLTALRSLMKLKIGDEVPTLLVGDFNLHSTSWSPYGWAPTPGVGEFEGWAALNTLQLLNVPGKPTRRYTFVGGIVDWPGSLGSDHALIHTLAYLCVATWQPSNDNTNSFDTDIDAEGWTEWCHLMALHTPTLHAPPRSTVEIDTVVDLVYAAFNLACNATMKRKGRNRA
ncbi:hypothetical protein EDB85DRAFT_2153449 [Lactarius pseudohatsudake]|nr:hypothetical protein EDB85DRAFT_2153449 [Lactarius pseudohatsudake]